MKSEVARLFVYQIEFNGSLFWSPVLLISNFIVLHYTSITKNISFKAEFSLSGSYVNGSFTDITITILEKFQSLRFFEVSF